MVNGKRKCSTKKILLLQMQFLQCECTSETANPLKLDQWLKFGFIFRIIAALYRFIDIILVVNQYLLHL